jgi:hypothetical protein
VEAAAREGRPGEGDIDPILDEGLGDGLSEASLLLLESGLQLPLELVGLSTDSLALVYGEVGKAAEHQGEASAASQVGDSPALKSVLIGHSIELAAGLGLYLCKRIVVRRHG